MELSRGPKWCFTWFGCGPLCLPDGAKYLVYGREVCPDTGRLHCQGFVIFSSSVRFAALKKWLPEAHFSSCKGTPQQNREYCTKDGDFVEIGSLPECRGSKEKRRWEEAFLAAREGRLDDIPADIRFRFYGTCKAIARDYMVSPVPRAALDNIWYVGPTGCGKSSRARLEYPGAYYKMANKWWDGYQMHKAVILEDLDLVHRVLAYHIKIWADHGPFIAETKGGALFIRPDVFVITSNYTPEQIWSSLEDEGSLLPILRRFRVVSCGGLE